MVRVDRNKLRTEQWNDRHRDKIGTEECDDNSESECRKEAFAYSIEEYHGEKDDTGADRGSQDGKLYLFASILCSDSRRLTHLHVAEDVLENHYRVVDQS